MMRYLLTVPVIVLAALPAGAVVTPDTAVSEQPPTGFWEMDWSFNYKYKGSSAVAIAPNWLLTAHHVADDAPVWSMTVGETIYTEVDRVYHTPAADPSNTKTADLALVRVDNELPGWYDIYTGTYPLSPRRDAMLIGHGYAGTVTNSSFNWSTGADRIRRWGSQKVDEEYFESFGGGTFQFWGLRMMFSRTDGYATEYESGAALFDSGGATFVKDGDDWKVAGINTNVYGSSPAYTGTLAVSVRKYKLWIDDTLAWYATVVPGDADHDGDVDVNDLSVVADNWGATSGKTWWDGNFDGDGDVDINDLALLAANWNGTVADYLAAVSGSAIPEPASVMVLVAGAALLMLRRRRRHE